MRFLPVLVLISAASWAAAQQGQEAAAKICTSVKNLRVSTITPTSPTDKNWLNHCNEWDLYYGASPHQDVDYPAARRCALYKWNIEHHRTPGDAGDFFDTGDFSTQTLLMIYGNGDGVQRNLDLAIHIACQDFPPPGPIGSADDQSVEIVLELAKTKSAQSPAQFNYCKDVSISDWREEMVCESVETGLARKKREAQFAGIAALWTSEQKDAFNKARAAFKKYEDFEELAENTCAVQVAGCTMRIDDDLETKFAEDIDRFNRGDLPGFTRQQYVADDGALNAAYREARKDAGPDLGQSSAFWSGRIRDSERAWLAYRDAFVTFAKIRWPGVRDDSWLAFLTRERTRQIQSPNW